MRRVGKPGFLLVLLLVRNVAWPAFDALFPNLLKTHTHTDLIGSVICCQGDVWICMELMDTSLDKFYKQVMEKDLAIPEDILGKMAVSVSSRDNQPVA